MKRTRTWALLMVAGLLLTACGGGDDPEAEATGTPTEAEGTSEPTNDEPTETEAEGDAVADFYSENDITIISGGGPAGGAYAYAELVSRHISQYIPGNPDVVLEARPGAGTMINANELANTDPKDGTVFGHIHSNMLLAEAMGDEQAQFSFAEYGVIGAVDNAYLACAVHTRTGIESVEDLMNGESVTVGASRPGSGNHDTPAVLNAAIGTNFEIISGYDAGGGPILLAIERGEVDGGCGTASTFEVAFRDLIDAGDMKILVTIGETPDGNPLLEGVPAAEDFADSDNASALLNLVSAPASVAWPFVMPPGVPQERVEAIREAFEQTLQDPDLLAEAENANIVVNLRTHEDILEVYDRVMSASPEILEQFQQISSGE